MSSSHLCGMAGEPEPATNAAQKRGPVLDYGNINFVRHRREARADFLRISHDIDARHLLRFMSKHWEIKDPGIIVQMTGSAQDFDLPSRMTKPIVDGIVYAASRRCSPSTSGTRSAPRSPSRSTARSTS